jgi:hypothetical protein
MLDHSRPRGKRGQRGRWGPIRFELQTFQSHQVAQFHSMVAKVLEPAPGQPNTESRSNLSHSKDTRFLYPFGLIIPKPSSYGLV